MAQESGEVVPFPTSDRIANVEAEAAFLGALLFDNALYPRAQSALHAEDFSEPVHARIYEAACSLLDQGKAANAITLIPHFKGDEALNDLGGTSYLVRLTTDPGPALLAFDDIAHQIAELAARRRIVTAGRSIIEGAAENAANLDDVLAFARESFAPSAFNRYGADTFDLFDAAALEAMPAPEWYIHNLIGAESLAILYGEPGAGKSFIALDMALRLALGMDWHGIAAKRTGVLYIAAEGARGLGNRIAGWRLHNRLQAINAPFLAITEAVQVIDSGNRARLKRTIDRARELASFDIGMVVLDTVSRSIVGLNENDQETMSQFVDACDDIKRHCGGTLLGVHHSGKDKERGMRGSSVLPGGSDTIIRVEKSEMLVTLTTEKQKEAEIPPPIYMRMETQVWEPDDRSQSLSTLIPVRAEAPRMETLSMEQIRKAFGLLIDAWNEGKPLSNMPQAKRNGRYAPQIFARRFEGSADVWEHHIEAWLENGNLEFEMYDKKLKKTGLRVVDAIT